MNSLTQAVGWAGTTLVLIAYLLLSNGKLTAKSRTYQLMNLFGAIGIGINVFRQEAWPTFALQIAWGSIAIISLIKPKIKTIPKK